MNSTKPMYLLDSDVLMQAHRAYYAFDICSGFWLAILKNQSIVASIDKVLEEIKRGENKADPLKDWVKNKIPDTFFLSSNDADVVREYGQIVSWVGGCPYTEYAKAEFMTEADGWLVANAKTRGRIVVTQEVSEPKKLGVVKIPDVCLARGVRFKNTYDFLRDLGVVLKL